jgi:hypothetical protein
VTNPAFTSFLFKALTIAIIYLLILKMPLARLLLWLRLAEVRVELRLVELRLIALLVELRLVALLAGLLLVELRLVASRYAAACCAVSRSAATCCAASRSAAACALRSSASTGPLFVSLVNNYLDAIVIKKYYACVFFLVAECKVH